MFQKHVLKRKLSLYSYYFSRTRLCERLTLAEFGNLHSILRPQVLRYYITFVEFLTYAGVVLPLLVFTLGINSAIMCSRRERRPFYRAQT